MDLGLKGKIAMVGGASKGLGYAVARALKGDPATAGVRLLAVSGYASPVDQQRCLEAGFERHLSKPVDPEELLQLLQQG